MNNRTRLALVALAAVFVLLDVVKPLQLDDTAYSFYAHQLAQHPLDPYGFEVFWYQHPQPAGTVLAPPVLPYWWSVGLRLFGERPWLWKVWLLPLALVLVAALYALLRRCARGLEWPLLCLVVLSPALLPSLNLMLDVPALALALAAIALFLHACDRTSFTLAALAGLTAGLAMQTKYTALLVPIVLLVHALVYRKVGLGLVAAGVAVLVFGAWEGFLVAKYGESHFLHHLQEKHETWGQKSALLLPLLMILGGIAPAGAPLGLAALKARPALVSGAALLVALGYVLLAVVPGSQVFIPSDTPGHEDRLALRHLVFAASGGAGLLLTGWSAWRLCRLPRRSAWTGARRLDWFLVLWLGLEVAGALTLTPFPAARRVLGVVVVGALLLGRLAARTCRAPRRRRLVWGVAGVGAVLGLLFAVVDLDAAWAEKRLAERAARWVRQQPTAGKVWFVGHWGFQYYAERAGLRPLDPDQSPLHPGDWLIVPEARLNQQHIEDMGLTEAVAVLEEPSLLPLRTVSCFYDGRTPLEHHEGPALSVTVFRVTGEWLPASSVSDAPQRRAAASSAHASLKRR